jgi:hypothetical protein
MLTGATPRSLAELRINCRHASKGILLVTDSVSSAETIGATEKQEIMAKPTIIGFMNASLEKNAE